MGHGKDDLRAGMTCFPGKVCNTLVVGGQCWAGLLVRLFGGKSEIRVSLSVAFHGSHRLGDC
jgi:dienelactone hydrolase